MEATQARPLCWLHHNDFVCQQDWSWPPHPGSLPLPRPVGHWEPLLPRCCRLTCGHCCCWVLWGWREGKQSGSWGRGGSVERFGSASGTLRHPDSDSLFCRLWPAGELYNPLKWVLVGILMQKKLTRKYVSTLHGVR